MDIEKMKARLAEIVAEMRGINTAPEDLAEAERSTWTPDEAGLARFDELDVEAVALRADLEAIVERQKKIEAAAQVAGGAIGGSDGTDRGRFEPPNQNRQRDAYDVDSIRQTDNANDLRARLETGMEADKITPDDVKVEALRTVQSVRGGIRARRAAALHCLATGSEAYRSAFAKKMQGREWAFTPEEAAAVERAQSLTDADGGFAVPFTLDPTIIFTNASAINPFRRIGRVVTTVTDQWQGVTGGAASFSWDAEGAEVSDDSITLTDAPIPVHKMQGFIPYSIEIDGDWASLDGDLRMAMMEGRDELEAAAHWSGTGVGQPTGIETALIAAGLPPIVAASLPVNTFTSADVFNLQGLLPPRHRMANPTWVMDIATSNAIRGFDTGGGGEFWASLAPGAPPTILGWPWEEVSEMDSTADFAGAGTWYVLGVGDFSRFVIVDRLGMTVENIPHLFGAANRPTGQRGLYAVMRSGANVVDPNAFRLLRNITP